MRWHRLQLRTRLIFETPDPASIGDPATIRTTDLDPRYVLETRLLFVIWDPAFIRSFKVSKCDILGFTGVDPYSEV